MGIFAPNYFLSGIPLDVKKLDEDPFSVILKFLLMYIVMPLIALYTIVLYIYFLMILFTMTWPKGIISHLVLWYGVITTVVMFLVHRLKSEYRWAELFTKWLSRLILPLLIMMFVSMGIRINAYGVTVNRFLVLVLGIWVFLSMLYFVFVKEKRNVLLIASLALFAFLSAIGPWSAFNVSLNSQRNRLINLLKKNEMMENGRVVYANGPVSVEDRVAISGILSYIETYHAFTQLTFLPEGFNKPMMQDVFGFGYQIHSIDEDWFLNYARDEVGMIDIQGYGYAFYDLFYRGENQTRTAQNVRVVVYPNMERLVILLGEEEVYALELKEEVSKLVLGRESSTLTSEDMTLIDENEKVKVKIVFDLFYANRKTKTEIGITWATFDLLLGIK